MKKAMILAAVAGTAMASTASAFTFSLFNGNTITDNFWQNFQLDDSLVPAGVYTGYSVTFDWTSDIQGSSFSDTWSSEARIAFANEGGTGNLTQPTYSGAQTVYSAAASPSSGQAGNSFDTTLTFNGAFSTNYTGGDLFFNYRQTFNGTNTINWNSISVTLILGQNYMPGAPAAVQPTAIDLGVLGGPGNYVIDSFGSDYDTELGLYDQAGNLIANNDDAASTLQSLIDVAADTAFLGLDPGTYFVALGGFNTAYGATDFDVTGGNANGDYGLSINGNLLASGTAGPNEIVWFSFTVIPAPGTAALFALGGLAGVRRRRR